MYQPRFLIFLYVIFILTHNIFACVNDTECGDFGYVCANSPPNSGTCIYACHNSYECISGICDNVTSISSDYPHWLCYCENDECFISNDGSEVVCDNNHCVSK